MPQGLCKELKLAGGTCGIMRDMQSGPGTVKKCLCPGVRPSLPSKKGWSRAEATSGVFKSNLCWEGWGVENSPWACWPGGERWKHPEEPLVAHHDWGGTGVSPAPYPLAHQPLPVTGDQPQGGQATLSQGIVMAKLCGPGEVGGTQGEMARSGEAERKESGKEKEGKAAGLEHLTQRFSVLTDSLLWKLQLDKVSRHQ